VNFRVAAAIAVAVSALAVHAKPSNAQTPTSIYWQGGAPTNLTDANYTNGTTNNLTPTANDVVWLGADSTVNLSSTSVDFYRLRVGHNQMPTNPAFDAFPGDATLNVSNGAVINLVGGDSGTGNAGLLVGNIRNGTLNIDGPGTTVTSSRLIVIGAAPSQASRNGTVRITNGGSLIATDGNINLGLTTGSGNGMRGNLIVENGTVTALGAGADLNIGLANATSSFVLMEGTVQIADAVEVGTSSSGVNNASSFTMSGGTFSNGGNFLLGRGRSTGVTLNLSGGDLNVGNRFLMGGSVAGDDAGTTTGIVVNHTGGVLNTVLDVRVGDVSETGLSDSTYNLSGTGVINSTTGGIVGRQGFGTFIQTGGQANFFGTLSIGNREAALQATNGVYKISAGTLSAGAGAALMALNIAPNGTGEFRVIGDDASIDVLGNFAVNTTANGVGTLAFEFENGDLLSMIDVTDAATFTAGARLVLDITNASPTQTSYDLLTATSITDGGINFSGPAGWGYQIVSGGNGQILRAVAGVAPSEDADFNNDGTVDGADFLVWQRGFGAAGSPTTGDANNDGNVNDADLGIWKQQYGSTTPSPVASVPEPAAGVLGLVAAAMLTWRRRTA
jgi:hypothetical protein